MCQSDNNALTRLSEPFRLFFPVGVLWGIIGVALWPLFFAGALNYYPALAHPRLMIDGFAAFFIFGFMMTAGPRLLGAPAFGSKCICAIFGLACLSNLAFVFNQLALGDTLFALATLALLLKAYRAYCARTDMPPPGFPLAALGLICACVGSSLLALTATIWPNATAYALGKILLFQGFTMLPIIGVGAFFFPKIIGGQNRHDFDETMTPSAEWKRRFRQSIFAAIGFALSVVIELSGHITTAYTLRVLTLTAYIITQLPWMEFRRKERMHGLQLIFALSTIAIGLIGAAFFPGYKVAWLHAYFFVGLTGTIFLVSLRVVFGHSDRPDLIRKSVKIFAWVTGTLILAASTRIVADFRPDLRTTHYIYASALWLICAIVWLVFVAPKTKPPKPLLAKKSCDS
ncbi:MULTISPECIES: NnrS family protein [unclassified Lentimonas]|uniref:NnrS family protein n=1 Tax=unclassified Lentimonas TaxID=2630993 RepID=UPI00132101FF|nr:MULTISPECIES: NnrS family protein [unclassified Lentimonas]CAA6679438.1 Unannotated [Lentimonas sp. CC4]CAA6687109.1 Unannotated [Lentimonas sp. CC6]CAA7075544.1 Unannotated [Lentimonas sp. CC4]CAA7170311.1 Unannotated [Lentimonas sp. CC21]CAA7182605.1 Unannotated [Lentimonas sp. CC8]